MKIVNNHSRPVFVPYAGRTKRGVQLDPGKAGPEIPVTRLDEKQGRRIPRDLEKGVIKLMVSDQERDVLKDRVPAECLVCAGEEPKVEETPQVEDVTTETADEVTAEPLTIAETEEVEPEAPQAEITVEDETETTPEVEEPPAEKEKPVKVDAVAESLIADLTLLKPRSRAAKLRHLKKSEDKGVQAALPKVLEHFEALKNQEKDPETKAETVEKTEEQAGDKYDDMNDAELLSAAVTAGLDVNPGDSGDALRKALRAKDK